MSPIVSSPAGKLAKTVVGLVACVAIGLTAYATVTLEYDSTGNFTGYGFVGKGDVQTALGLNNSQLQAIANSLTFAYSETSLVGQDCQEKTNTGPGRPLWTVVGRRTKTSTVNAVVNYQTRTNVRQVTGFYLTGFGGTTVTGDAEWVVNSSTTATGCPIGSTPVGAPYPLGGSSPNGVLTVDGVPLPL